MALLAAYRVRKQEGESLEDYLSCRVFATAAAVTVQPNPEDAAGFETYVKRFIDVLPAEKAAAENLKN